MKTTLQAKSGRWKQHPDEIAAKNFFDSLSNLDRDMIMDDLVLGVGMDWIDYDMETPSGVFRLYFYKLLEQYDQEGSC